MSSTRGLIQLATLLQGHGLSATAEEGLRLVVANPISSALREDVRCEAGSYVTSWGYVIGQVGQESAAADRLAFLLGVPTGQGLDRNGALTHG